MKTWGLNKEHISKKHPITKLKIVLCPVKAKDNALNKPGNTLIILYQFVSFPFLSHGQC